MPFLFSPIIRASGLARHRLWYTSPGCHDDGPRQPVKRDTSAQSIPKCHYARYHPNGTPSPGVPACYAAPIPSLHQIVVADACLPEERTRRTRRTKRRHHDLMVSRLQKPRKKAMLCSIEVLEGSSSIYRPRDHISRILRGRERTNNLILDTHIPQQPPNHHSHLTLSIRGNL